MIVVNELRMMPHAAATWQYGVVVLQLGIYQSHSTSLHHVSMKVIPSCGPQQKGRLVTH